MKFPNEVASSTVRENLIVRVCSLSDQNLSLTIDETSKILNQSLRGRSDSLQEILDLGKNNKYPMGKIIFGPKIKEYTPILHFSKYQILLKSLVKLQILNVFV